MSDPLSRYSATRAMEHIRLSNDELTRLARELVKLIGDDGRARISDIHRTLFPLAEVDPANNSTRKLRKAINEAAKKQGVTLVACISRGKKGGADNRWFWFEGASIPPGLARTSELDSIPEERLVRDQRGRNAGPPTIVLLTFNPHETRAVKEVFDRHGEQVIRSRRVYTDLGVYGGTRVLHTVSRQGVSEAQLVAEECIRALTPDAIIGVGIAFGVDAAKQRIGDVLVSTGVNDYELQKVKQGVIEPRGLAAPASPTLLNRFIHLLHCWSPDGTDGKPRIIDGVLLSGNKLVDDVDYRDSLVKLSGTQIVGGEMEGLGIQKPAAKHGADWIVVKGICDFGDGNKGAASKERDQQFAARHAAQVVREALDVGPLYSDGWASPPPALPPFTDQPIWVHARGLHTTLDKEAPPSEGTGVDVMDQLTTWALDPEAPSAFALLGEYGMGKTVTTQRFARHLRERREADPRIPLSLYFDLREVTGLKKKVPTLKKIVTEVMGRTWPAEDGEDYTYRSFRTWLQEPAVVIFDGLDEVLVKLTEGDGQTFTRTLLSILSPPPGRPIPKVLISCRTQYFRTLRDQRNHFTGQERGNVRADSFRAMVLLPFDEAQVVTYLEAAFPGDDPQRLLDTVRSVHNLNELTKRPYTLSLITAYLPEIERDRARGKPVCGVTLYRRTAQSWLDRDEGKHQIKAHHKPALAAHLAAYLWISRQQALPASEIERWFYEWLDSDRVLSRRYRDVDPDRLEEDLRTATFLTRVDSGSDSAFRFSHTSLQEYFLAEYLLDAVRLDLPERWCLPLPSDETFDFLGQLLAEASDPALLSTLSRWAPTYRRDGSENLLRFTLRAREKGLPRPSLRGIDLAGSHLDDLVIRAGGSAFDLTGANLSGASLRRAAFHRVTLTRANLSRAVLHQAYLLECVLDGADLTQTDLTGAAIRHSRVPDLADARTAGLQQEPTRTQDRALERAALAESPPAQLVWTYSTPTPTAIAFSPDGTTLATSGDERTVQLWTPTTGTLLTTLTSPTSGVSAIAYSHDGTTLATGSSDGTIRLWNPTTGTLLTTLTGHTRRVHDVTFSPDGTTLATASSDGTIRLWNPGTGDLRVTLTGNGHSVRAIAYSPDGTTLATGSSVGTIRLWNPTTGTLLTTITGHTERVTTLAYSPDGTTLATASWDATIRLWNPTTGQHLTTLTGPTRGVNALAYSPDGTTLATASNDATIRLWNPTTGQHL
ncbi:MAG TPA: NACHT domain-containing protein, partial [Arachnia sp.]|nr:NACHT domain-containing protein [Arachnia sp.]HMT86389.1 NACHT domain-containing protein [Arachnia sp.]